MSGLVIASIAFRKAWRNGDLLGGFTFVSQAWSAFTH